MTRLSLVASSLCCALLGACKSADGPQPGTAAVNQNNELPFGYIDSPATGQHLPRIFATQGWALDDTGIASIRLFVDNKYFMTVDRRTVRDDLMLAYPEYASRARRHGWVATVELPPTVPAGPHTLLVQATDVGGLTRDLGSVSIVLDPAVPPVRSDNPSPPPTLQGEIPIGAVDQPHTNAKVPRTFEVNGWALDDRGVREIRVFVDRVFNTILVGRYARGDVFQIRPEWTGANPMAGWSGSLTLTPGSHSLIFQAVDTDGLTSVLGIVAVIVSD